MLYNEEILRVSLFIQCVAHFDDAERAVHLIERAAHFEDTERAVYFEVLHVPVRGMPR